MSKRKVEISCQPDYLNYVGLNQFQNHRRVNIFGNNPSTTGIEDVWTAGGLIPRPLTATSNPGLDVTVAAGGIVIANTQLV